jgi:hypothetical protein
MQPDRRILDAQENIVNSIEIEVLADLSPETVFDFDLHRWRVI